MNAILPSEILDFINGKSEIKAALIGCRAHHPEISYPCCEYDIAIIDQRIIQPKIINIGDNIIEYANFSSTRIKNINSNIIPISDFCNLQDVHNFPKMLTAEGRHKLIDALFNLGKIDLMYKSGRENLALASLILEISSYDILLGILQNRGIQSMPIHEINQLRNLDTQADVVNQAIQTALECIGMDRATRSSIDRRVKAFQQIFGLREDFPLLMKKINFLLQSKLLTDCYYYVGKITSSYLKMESNIFFNYPKLTHVAMDMSNDFEKMKKLAGDLKVFCKKIIRA